MSPTSTAEWAPLVGMSKLWRYANHLRSATWVQLTSDNILAWWLGLKGRREYEDVEGPLYIFGAPSRQIEDGKAVLASADVLEHDKGHIYLFILELKSADGSPLPFGEVDLWQTDGAGSYYCATYTLRGRAMADAQGRVEVLTVRPGAYAGRNVGHIHIILSGVVRGESKTLTTQAYICPGNDAGEMRKDFVTRYYGRKAEKLVVQSWKVGDANIQYFGFSQLPEDDIDSAKSVAQWSARLQERGIKGEIVAVGRHTLKLT